jgi:O-antigen ligase
MAFVGLGFLVLTKSRTSIVCLILAGSIVALLGWSRKQKAALIFALLSAMLLLYVYQYDASSIIPKFVMASRGNASNLDLEGRVPIWELCIAYASARPLLGYGFEGFWNPSHIEWISSELHWAIPAAHNGYLDLVLSVGVIGLLLYVSQMGQALVRSFRSYQVTQASEWAFAIALLVFYVATMLTEAIATEMSLTRLIVFVVVMWHPTTERDKTMTTARQPVESTEHDLSHSFGDPLMMGGSLALQTDANGIEKRPNSIVS